MGKYKPLTIMDLFELIDIFNEDTKEEEKLKNAAEKRYNEILEYINETGMSGELIIKLKISKDNKKERVSVLAEVSKRLKKIKNEINLEQDDAGNVFLDNPDQHTLPGVLTTGVSEE